MSERFAIAIRPERATDRGFVATRWRGSLRKRWPYRMLDAGFYHASVAPLVDNILADVGTEVAIAALPKDDDVIVGFVVFDSQQRLLHYMYTKAPLRGHGIASRLLDHSFAGTEPVTATIGTPELRHYAARWNVEIDPSSLPSLVGAAPSRTAIVHPTVLLTGVS